MWARPLKYGHVFTFNYSTYSRQMNASVFALPTYTNCHQPNPNRDDKTKPWCKTSWHGEIFDWYALLVRPQDRPSRNNCSTKSLSSKTKGDPCHWYGGCHNASITITSRATLLILVYLSDKQFCFARVFSFWRLHKKT